MRELRDVPLRPAVVVRIGGSPRRQAAGERTGEGEPVLDRRSAVPPATIICAGTARATSRGRSFVFEFCDEFRRALAAVRPVREVVPGIGED